MAVPLLAAVGPSMLFGAVFWLHRFD